MYNFFPYDNFAKRIAEITLPFNLEKFEIIFQDISSETIIKPVNKINIQNDFLDVFLITPREINEKFLPVPPAYFFYKVQIALILGVEYFYLLFHCGTDPIITDHTFYQNVNSMRHSPTEYRHLGPGRFVNNNTGTIFSAEEDEIDVKYLLLTNSEWLLNTNEIFCFTRDLLTIQNQKSHFSPTPHSSTINLNTMKLDFFFKSSDHLRYENGRHVSGPHGGAGRAVKVEPNLNGGEGFSVTMYNLDGNHPVWQNNIQMAPKQMKVIEQTNDKIVLLGYGHDEMGASFADYGLTIKLKNGALENCILHMHDRGVDIEYLP